MTSFLKIIQISRPGLWLVFVWLYLWPTAKRDHLLCDLKFFLGLLYSTFPLNLLVYGMNDLVDEDTDCKNPRKGNFIFGAKIPKRELLNLPGIIALVNLFPLTILTILDNSLFYLVWLGLAVLVNVLYNHPPFQLSRKSPWEIPCMIVGHLLIPLLSCKVNRVPLPGRGSVVFHILLLTRSHLWLEIMDISEDERCGKRTSAVVLGEKWSTILVFGLILAEAFVARLLLASSLLFYFSLFGAGVFALMTGLEQAAHIPVNKKQACISQSLVGFVLMLILWSRGDLLI